MKIARFSHDNRIAYGIIDETEIVVLDGDPMYAGFDTTGERVPLGEVTLLAPVIPRSKIVAVGKNYRDHVTEMGGADATPPAEPLLFFKPNTSVIGPENPIVIPPITKRVSYEAELAIIIGSVAKNVPAADADKVVFGYTIANDVTARDLQESDGQWARAKGLDSFCPIGPIVETEFDPAGKRIISRLNGEVRQDGVLDDMIHDIPKIIEYVSAAFTLLPGDIILTGTPAGVGEMNPGDRVECEIEGLGILSNPVR
ncbi:MULTISPECIES: fumarylacetoacetate hydrolase family protein [Mycetocola]|uniref:fumarylacetoacetate hydrolase family protein n=1 Tax=Mycetocola TaxID=76634 RepID=UPI0004C1947C|nr:MULTISPECIES: fumarylacetoacetate hydrolase family protein [Mycetocola]